MGNKIFGLYALLFLTIHAAHASAPVTMPGAEVGAAKAGYTLSPELEKLIEKYQDPAYLEELTHNVAKFEHPDFLHKILHARETGLELIDTLNKKILYEFPSFIRAPNGKAVGIFACDLITLGTHTAQYLLDKSSIQALNGSLAHAFTKAILEDDEQMALLLEQRNTEAVIAQLIQTVWESKVSISLLGTYLTRRLVHAGLEYAKKEVTPPPFYIHGKTTQGQAADQDLARITPITTIFPEGTIEAMFDHTINDNSEEIRSSLGFNIASQYLIEGAKQLEWIGSIDEGALFIVAKEMATSMLFFHYDLKNSIHGMLRLALCMQTEALHNLLMRYREAQKNLTLSEEGRAAEKKQCAKALELFFNTALQQRQQDLLINQRFAQRRYNTITNALLLTPALYKIVSLGWKLLKAVYATQKSATVST